MTTLITTYDETQHCTAFDRAKGKSVAIDCPYSGKGEELSPVNLLEAALSSCIMMSMGAVAMRDGIDLTETSVEMDFIGTSPPKIGYSAININVTMPAGLSPKTREKLQRGADACPIKHTIDPEIAISVDYRYPD